MSTDTGAVARGLLRRGFAVPPHERIVLGNGMTVVIAPRRDVPLVSFQLLLRGGALCDPPGKAGVAALTAALLDKGAGRRHARAFAEAVENVGGSFMAAAGPEAISVHGQFLRTHQELMLRLLADAVMAPRPVAAQLQRVRSRQSGWLLALKDSDPSELLPLYGRAQLFADHPYGRPVCGSEDSLGAIGLADVHEVHRAQVGADRAVLVVAGDVDVGWLKQAAAQLFGDWRQAAWPLPVLQPTAAVTRRKVLLVDAPGSAQSYFWLGGRGVDRSFGNYAGLDLVNTLFGGRFTSMLNTELRIRTGLTYGVSSSFVRGRAAGEFAIRSSTETPNTVRALDLALAALDTLKHQGVSDSMLDSARAYVSGQYPMSFETAADWAATLAELEIHGLSTGRVEDYLSALRSVDVAQAGRVIAQAFPTPDELIIAVIGDAAQLRGQLERYGPVAELPLSAGSFSP